MAFTVTARHSGNSNGTPAQTLTTDSTTPTADSLLIVASGAQNQNNGTTQVIQTPVGGSLTYTKIVESASVAWNGDGAYLMKGVAYSAPVGGSPGAHTVTVDHQAGVVEPLYSAVCCDITGHDAGDPIVQFDANAASVATGDAHAGTVVLDAAPAAGNLVVVAFFSGADTGGGFASPTMGSGKTFTQLFNQSVNLLQGGLWYREADGAEVATITCSDVGNSVGQWSAVAFEVAAAAGGTNFTRTVDDTVGLTDAPSVDLLGPTQQVWSTATQIG